ncbi:hypothetical protein [Bifidobacterium stellenboschense]|uniref:Uncharacterized protein n=1 Tax=Bifidobacterium stellenboschense TaxID=762211 RepID=A0A087DQN6_9BIFI|nr:hypothetical protein [Bifidobacterium stellenboschense]KFI97836.1 hypothetical protein BSTEL_0647 [Bifidobacterium stellenboschense]
MSTDVDDIREYLKRSIHRMSLVILDADDYTPLMRSAQAKRDAYRNVLNYIDKKQRRTQ